MALEGTAFHAFCDMSILIGLDVKTFTLILKYGADPNIECNGLYPLNLIFEQFVCHNVDKLTEKDLEMFLKLLHVMSYKAVNEIRNITTEYKDTGEAKKEEYKTKILQKLNDVLSKVSLKTLTQHCILTSCQRKMAIILKLPIPMPLKTEILQFIIDVI